MLRVITDDKLAPFEQFDLYLPFIENKDAIFKRKLNIEEIVSSNEEMKNELEAFLAKLEGKQDDYIYMPLNARYHNVVLIFSKNGNIVGTLNAPYK